MAVGLALLIRGFVIETYRIPSTSMRPTLEPGDTLFVSDVTGVRKFDRRTGAPRGFVPIPGATFLNDLTSDGRSVYVSDTGLAMGSGVTFIRTAGKEEWGGVISTFLDPDGNYVQIIEYKP